MMKIDSSTGVFDLHLIDPVDYWYDLLPEEDLLLIFELCGAFWLHDGDIRKPHAELSSGKCSNGFIDCGKVFRFPNLTELFARQIMLALERDGLSEHPDWVIGAPYGSLTLGHEVAKFFIAQYGFTEKDMNDPSGKRMRWDRFIMPHASTVLVVEDVVTTFSTVREIRMAISRGNPHQVNFLPYVGAVAYRPGKDFQQEDAYGIHVAALMENAVRNIWVADPDACPLCAQGSARLRPKYHWSQLKKR